MPTVVVLSSPAAAGVAELTAAVGDRAELVIADSPAALAAHLPAAEVVVVWEYGLRGMLADHWSGARSLRWVHSKSAGVDALLFPELVAGPVTLTNSSGVYSQALAEFAVGAILYFTKQMRRMLDNHAHRRWQEFEVARVSGTVLGLCGFGSVGRAVAAAGRALGMRVLATRRDAARPTEAGLVDQLFGPAELPAMLAASDYVVVCLPLTRATRGLIGAAELAAMKAGAYLVNIARGEIVREAALIAALRSGHLAGAALDVYEVEPLPADSPLYDLDNVLLSPHCADRTSDAVPACVDLFAANLDRYLAGTPLLNVVDKQAGY